ncbi:MAG: TIGR03986 family CRISPR-associated RAMP protein, partial [Synechococcaceae cyanobacterium SM2_3_2]|nr:TIGR03986 family CRISPR-associated RAMP protein [Synechococcaceae cyanobacterium SM2_3_2]
MLVPDEQLSVSLRAIKKKDIKSLADLEVELDEENGQPKQVRERGKAWIELPEGDFHNPYNFIPAPPRNVEDPHLGDHHPVGHGSYHLDHFSGRIEVTLKTITPLLIPDAATATEIVTDHKLFDVRMGSDGKPYLPPTSIKGILRSAYEAVTNSRLAIFESHEDRLAYRMPAKLGPIPARVELNNKGELCLRVMTDSSIIGNAAKLPRYASSDKPPDKGESTAALRYKDASKELPQHGDHVWVQVTKSKVSQIIRWTKQQPTGSGWKEGWVCITGANIRGKKNERVFVVNNNNQLIKVTDEIRSLWEELIKNYQSTHEKDLEIRKKNNQNPNEYLGHEPGKTAWSRHIYVKSESKLVEGTLCYVELSGTKVSAVQPVTISRRLYKNAPSELLDESLKPATRIDDLSPADRVFGWVRQDKQDNKSQYSKRGAYKGNLRISPAICTTLDPVELPFGDNGFPLAILGQPKPEQFRFYAAHNREGGSLPVNTSQGEA